jgi:sulfoxide reductase heme-binding subunit YedZ
LRFIHRWFGRQQSRLTRRLISHHLPIFGCICVAVTGLYFTRPFKDVVTRASFATAYPAFALLSATLLLGPLNLLRGRPNPVSIDLRRDCGIWAGILGIAHAAVGQFVHLRGRPWLYYIYGPTEHHHRFLVRHDLFGLANYSGALGTLLLIALLATSNDISLRRLRGGSWKALQRWNYAVFALAAIHAIAFQAIEKQKRAYVAVVAACIATAATTQCAGWIKRRLAARKLPARKSEASA